MSNNHETKIDKLEKPLEKKGNSSFNAPPKPQAPPQKPLTTPPSKPKN